MTTNKSRQLDRTQHATFALNRRGFLKTALKAGAAAAAAPMIVRGAVLGRDGGVAPSERIVLGGIGIGNRGRYVLSCFLPQPDVQFVAVCDVQARRRESVKKMVDDHYGHHDCDMLTDPRELLARNDIDQNGRSGNAGGLAPGHHSPAQSESAPSAEPRGVGSQPPTAPLHPHL